MADKKYAFSGNTAMLVLKLLEEKDMYGYQIIQELSSRSQNVFHLKTGTLYPLLHNLENVGMIISYDDNADNMRIRKYYRITSAGIEYLRQEQAKWQSYSEAVNHIISAGKTGGESHAHA